MFRPADEIKGSKHTPPGAHLVPELLETDVRPHQRKLGQIGRRFISRLTPFGG